MALGVLELHRLAELARTVRDELGITTPATVRGRCALAALEVASRALDAGLECFLAVHHFPQDSPLLYRVHWCLMCESDGIWLVDPAFVIVQGEKDVLIRPSRYPASAVFVIPPELILEYGGGREYLARQITRREFERRAARAMAPLDGGFYEQQLERT